MVAKLVSAVKSVIPHGIALLSKLSKKGKETMSDYKVGDKVKVVRTGLDITGKTAIVTDEALPGYDYVLIKLDDPNPENVSQLGRISIKEIYLSRV